MEARTIGRRVAVSVALLFALLGGAFLMRTESQPGDEPGPGGPDLERNGNEPAPASQRANQAAHAGQREPDAPGAAQDTGTLAQVLARHHVLAQKAVPLAAERLELNALLSDRDRIEDARNRLLARAPDAYDHADQEERLDVVAYLT